MPIEDFASAGSAMRSRPRASAPATEARSRIHPVGAHAISRRVGEDLRIVDAVVGEWPRRDRARPSCPSIPSPPHPRRARLKVFTQFLRHVDQREIIGVLEVEGGVEALVEIGDGPACPSRRSTGSGWHHFEEQEQLIVRSTGRGCQSAGSSSRAASRISMEV